MSLTLTLREPPAVVLDARALRPDALAGLGTAEVERITLRLGRGTVALGELFAVTGTPGAELRIAGDLRPLDGLGADMTGGVLVLDGDAGDGVGSAMRGGRIEVTGRAGDRLGAAHPGERAGMTGGEIVVRGDAGDEAGAGLRRGLIGVGGRAGDAAGWRMLAGTLVALGGCGAHAGGGLRRGTIVTMAPVTPLPTFAYATTYRPPFLGLVLRRLRALGLPVSDAQLGGRYARWAGDGLELGRGELLVLEPGR